MRKLASVRTVDRILPIAGADRIETAVFGGWHTIVGKDEFVPGDLAVYFEIDTFLPATNPAFAQACARGTQRMERDGIDVEGHVLRTMKMRGVYSQGLALPPASLGLDPATLKPGDDVTDQVGVWKWQRPAATQKQGKPDPQYIGDYDPSLAPKTGAVRIQNLPEGMWATIVSGTVWVASEKIDGMSVTLARTETGEIRVFSHNKELDPAIGWGKRILDTATGTEIGHMLDSGLVVQGELAGPGIQSNPRGLTADRLYVFATWRDQTKVMPTGSGADAPLFADSQRGGIPADVTEALALADKSSGEGFVVHVFAPRTVHGEEWDAICAELGPTMEVKVVSNAYLARKARKR